VTSNNSPQAAGGVSLDDTERDGTTSSGTVQIRTRVAGPAVSTTQLDGQTVVLCRLDSGEVLSALSEAVSESLEAASTLALEKRLPLVVVARSSGADVREGIGAAHGWGRAARAMVRCSGQVPVVFIVSGAVVTGSALLLGIADHVVMVDESYAFVSGPGMVEAYTGEPIETEALGGADVHATTSGLASVRVSSVDDAFDVVADLLSYLPSDNTSLPPNELIPVAADSHDSTLNDIVPANPTGSYDVRHVIERLVDEESFLELRSRWAGNLVTGLATIGGHCVGILANQPQILAGTLNIAASHKGARFVSFCDAFNLPIITLVDTPGFQPGKDLEWRGMIRHGAQLAFAYARATVPRISVTLRKSYGGAYIVMDSKPMGNDIAYAWPSAEIAVMGAKGAIEILHRKADDGDRAQLEADYEERLLNPYRAAERGSIDAVIDPAETRHRVAAALDLLTSKRERLPRRRHDNIPL